VESARRRPARSLPRFSDSGCAALASGAEGSELYHRCSWRRAADRLWHLSGRGGRREALGPAGEARLNRLQFGRSRFVLGLLLVAYTLNFLDRQIVSILKIPIKAELGLSDTQLGLMGGIAFASVYSTLAIPFARYADRKGRVRVIAVAVATWSLFTALCGVVTSFGPLFA